MPRTHLRVGPQLKLAAAVRTLAGEAKYGRREVVANLALLGVEADAGANMSVARAAPDVERQLEADDQDALVDLAGPVAQGVLRGGAQPATDRSAPRELERAEEMSHLALIVVKSRMFLPVKVRRVVCTTSIVRRGQKRGDISRPSWPVEAASRSAFQRRDGKRTSIEALHDRWPGSEAGRQRGSVRRPPARLGQRAVGWRRGRQARARTWMWLGGGLLVSKGLSPFLPNPHPRQPLDLRPSRRSLSCKAVSSRAQRTASSRA